MLSSRYQKLLIKIRDYTLITRMDKNTFETEQKVQKPKQIHIYMGKNKQQWKIHTLKSAHPC